MRKGNSLSLFSNAKRDEHYLCHVINIERHVTRERQLFCAQFSRFSLLPNANGVYLCCAFKSTFKLNEIVEFGIN